MMKQLLRCMGIGTCLCLALGASAQTNAAGATPKADEVAPRSIDLNSHNQAAQRQLAEEDVLTTLPPQREREAARAQPDPAEGLDKMKLAEIKAEMRNAEESAKSIYGLLKEATDADREVLNVKLKYYQDRAKLCKEKADKMK